SPDSTVDCSGRTGEATPCCRSRWASCRWGFRRNTRPWRLRSSLERFHQFEPVSERVRGVDSVVPREIVIDDVHAGLTKLLHQRRQISYEQGGVRRSGGAEIGLDAEMDLHRELDMVDSHDRHRRESYMRSSWKG